MYVVYMIYIICIYIYICICILAVYAMSTVGKSAKDYCSVFISILINGRRINYKYISYIANDSFICVLTIFRLYNIEEKCLMVHLYDR